MASSPKNIIQLVTQRYSWREITIILSLVWAIFAIAGSIYRFINSGEFPNPVSDFLAFYATSSLIQQGAPELPYDLAAYSAEQARYFFAANQEYGWFYAPPTHFLVYPLAWAPIALSYILLSIIGIAALLLSSRFVLQDKYFALAPPLFACSAWAVSLVYGQLTILLVSAILMGFGNLMRGKQITAGLWFGLMMFKPHYGVLLPIFLLARGDWRAIFSTGATAITLCVASYLCFGEETWLSFIHNIAFTQEVVKEGLLKTVSWVSVFEFSRQINPATSFAWTCQGIAFTLAAIAVWKTATHPIAWAGYSCFCLATLFASPWLHTYDLIWLHGMLIFILPTLPTEQFTLPHKLALACIWLIPWGLITFPASGDLVFGAVWLLVPVWFLYRTPKQAPEKNKALT